MKRRPQAVLALAAALALAGGTSPAGDRQWSGDGPFPPGTGSRAVNALALDTATGTLYAGTGSGTVFAFSDSDLSEPPRVMADGAVTNPDTAVDIAVLANDSDPEGALDEGSVAIRTTPANGTALANADGAVTYTPDAGFVGTDGFTYTVRDRAGAESAAAMVNVRVNAPPAAGDDSATTDQGKPVTIDVLANDGDTDGTVDPATVAIQDAPANGAALANADGTVTYTPDGGFAGTDSFTYLVGDDDGAVSQPATVTVSVRLTGNLGASGADSGGGCTLGSDNGRPGLLLPLLLLLAGKRLMGGAYAGTRVQAQPVRSR